MSIIKTLDLTSGSRSEISAACFKRILDRQPTTNEPYPMRTLYPSGIYDLHPRDAVLAYYVPDIQVDNWTKLMYTSHGTAAEQIIQSGLFRAGVLDCKHSEFREPKVYCPEIGVSGRADGIAFKELLKHHGAIDEPTEAYDGELTPIILEFKETSYYQYSLIEGPGDIPMKFQWAQAIYQMVLKIPETCFVYINRDSMELKTVFFSSDRQLQQDVCDKCILLWDAINTKSWTDEDGTKVTLDEFLSERVND